MNLNKKIGVLLDNGFNPKFISSLNENKINFLFEKISKREETKEVTMVSKTDTETQQKLQSEKKPYEVYEEELNDDEFYTDISGITQDREEGEGPDYPGSDRGKTGEQESLEEKFESKAQQGLFWARCNKCKTDDCKWCKMAKEFSKETSKKQYKTMPEKKHPEKTVKYKKKETNEEFTMANYFDKVASVHANNAMGKTVDSLTKEQIINKHLTKLVESNLKPTIKKQDLIQLINNQKNNK